MTSNILKFEWTDFFLPHYTDSNYIEVMWYLNIFFLPAVVI